MLKGPPRVGIDHMGDQIRVRRREALGLASGALATGLAGCGMPAQRLGGLVDQRTSVRTVLNWKPNPTQAGYFVARERGYYEEEGLRVELVPGQGGRFATKQVGLENAEFGLASGVATLQARANDLPVRSYAAAQQSSNAALFTTRGAFGGELSDPEQLAGTRIAVVTGSAKTMAYVEAMLAEAGVRDGVELVTVGVEQQTSNLLAGNVDVATGIFSNALALQRQGYDASMLLVGKYVPTIGRTVVSRPGFAADQPAAVRGFLRATARGWLWAANNPSAAEDVMIEEKPSLEESRELGVTKIEFTAKNLVSTPAVARNGWGWQSGDVWTTVHETVAANDVVTADLAVEDAWTNEFLDASAAAIGEFGDRADTDYAVAL